MNLIAKFTSYCKHFIKRKHSDRTIHMTFCSPDHTDSDIEALSQLSHELLTTPNNSCRPQQEQVELIDEVQQYITQISRQFFDGEALQQAIRIFNDFAHGNIGNIGEGIPATPPELTAKDLMHFSWNIWNRLHPISRKTVPKFLKRALPLMFHDISESSIYYKMTNDDGTYSIPIIKSGKLTADVNTF